MAAGDTASSGGNLLTRKAGPLPTWGWLAIITVAGLGYYLWHKSHSAAAATTATSTAPGQTSASNVPDYVFQNYNQIPPTAPAPVPPPTAPPAPAPTQPPPSPAPAPSPRTPLGSVPNLRGMTLAAATAALQGTGYSISNVSSGYKDLTSAQIQAAQSRTIYSYTPYSSNGTVRIGLN